MGIELFGSSFAAPLFAACAVAYVLSGHRGIYLSQRIGIPKAQGIHIRAGALLSDAREGRRMHIPTARRKSAETRPQPADDASRQESRESQETEPLLKE